MLNPPKGSIPLNVFSLGLCHVSIPLTLTLRAAFASSTYLHCKYPDPLVSIPLTPFSMGHIRPSGFPSPHGCHCSPTPAGRLMTCINPPTPLFKGAHQAFVHTRAHGHRFAVLRPASDDALLLLLDNGRTAVLPAANCEAPSDNQTYAEFKYITCIYITCI